MVWKDGKSYESDYEKAFREGKRVFFEQATGTIRQCPENYCLAFFDRIPSGFRWVAFKDEGAIRASRHRIQYVLDHCDGLSGPGVAERLENELFPRKKGHSRP